MKDHFVKLKTFKSLEKKKDLNNEDILVERVAPSYTVFNLANVVHYTTANDPESVLIVHKNNKTLDHSLLTAVRVSSAASATTLWLNMTVDAFDEIYRAYLKSQGIEYTNYATV